MNINVSCEKCGDSLEVIREWSDRSGVEITVLPCGCCPSEESSSKNLGHCKLDKDRQMMIKVYTRSEFYALYILYGRCSNEDPHKAANEIIELAERIKAERAVAAMNIETGRLLSPCCH